MDKVKDLLERLRDTAKADLEGACDDDSTYWASVGINNTREALQQYDSLLEYINHLEMLVLDAYMDGDLLIKQARPEFMQPDAENGGDDG